MNLESYLSKYRSGFSLEQAFYTDFEIFNAEWNSIFKTSWLYAGNVAQIPKAGDYFLYHLRHESIIVIRGNGDVVHAHYNTCRHRGSAICLTDTGHASRLVCPYHLWVYDKDGELLNARMMSSDFDKTNYHLHHVHVKQVEGLIFISLAKDAPDFSSIEKSLAPYLKPYHISKAKVACIKKHTIAANWKLVAENFRECYHCGGAHPEYCSAVIGANLNEDVVGLTHTKQNDWKERGLETRLVEVTDGTTTYAIRYPLRPGIESYSVDGKKVSVPMGSHRDYDAGVVGLVNYPNFWLDAVSDYVWTMRVTPIDASSTEVEFCWLVDENTVEGKDYEVKNLTKFWDVTGQQDATLCENNFRGILSQAYQPGPYAPVEDQVVNFIDWCINKLKSGLSRS
ncbi:MAG TPA: Rieske (2Fe-2S) protein [Cytophagales bacterium]|jgi:phenylpropionate dioxygenase-like ring-hydroxylating dioxygenase large terminal subunit|nr:Rieske (2Fe-2S) protein [Cytophagales bacterium]